MANEQWYALKVRPSFQAIAAEKLRKLNVEVFVPESPSAGYVYCRFAFENRPAITSIPGVIDILGTPEPEPIDGRMAALHQKATHS